MSDVEEVIVKLQKPIYTNGDKNEILSYIVDENDEQVSNPTHDIMSKEAIDYIFGDYVKVYYLAEHVDGETTELVRPVKQEWWQE